MTTHNPHDDFVEIQPITQTPQSAPKPAKLPPVTLSQQDLADINAHLNQSPVDLLKVPAVRMILTRNRMAQVNRESIERAANVDSAVIDNCIEYNMSCLADDVTHNRPERLIAPLCQIGFIARNMPKMRVLTVGPRSESELLCLISSGFNENNIRGLDLFSFSPYIDAGDMHAMPYPDHSFDIIILGWVLAYSKDNKKAAQEVLRVAKPGAHIAIGCQVQEIVDEAYWEQWSKANNKPHVTAGTKFKHTNELLALFGTSIDRVIFQEDAHPEFEGKTYDIMTIFRLK
ncbi:class I SAM-dependent methyltransferase [Hahella sp. HN01]|uniref:class I SAM-dependent methyltransferase n=1 Tax=Hahella sp. HN01 TaxID=2847262 RepID=UPI001C1EDF52|nr:class I SAM-dependent methyltransferase [Hahella sp. HN01]MBU6953029.1 class I SAM-dependent methyltransferase [Hahella sp. HN01]